MNGGFSRRGSVELKLPQQQTFTAQAVESPLLKIPLLGRTTWIALLVAAITDHFDVGDLQMSVLMIVFFQARILGHIFRIFLHVVRGRVRDYARRRNRVPHVLGQ